MSEFLRQILIKHKAEYIQEDASLEYSMLRVWFPIWLKYFRKTFELSELGIELAKYDSYELFPEESYLGQAFTLIFENKPISITFMI